MQKYQQLLNHIQSAQLQTPFYGYDLDRLEKRFHLLKQSLGDQFQINYSMKANPNLFVLKKMKMLSPYIDVSSMGEIELALKAGYSFTHMSFVGPGKSKEELHFAIANDIGCLIVESAEELTLISKICAEIQRTARFCFRINPEKLILDNGKIVLNRPSQFGIDQNQIIQLKSFLTGQPRLELQGLHFYLQSQFLNSKSIVANFQNCIDVFNQIQFALGVQLRKINFGGGFGISYFDGQPELNLSEFSHEIQNLLHNNPEFKHPDLELFVESGRFLMGPSGVFVTKIIYKKISQQKIFLICDGGFTQNMASTGIGQVVRRNYKIHSLGQNPSSEMQLVTIAGPSCYSIDILANDINLNVVNVGDYIVIENSGSYGKTFSPEGFLLRPASGEYILSLT